MLRKRIYGVTVRNVVLLALVALCVSCTRDGEYLGKSATASTCRDWAEDACSLDDAKTPYYYDSVTHDCFCGDD